MLIATSAIAAKQTVGCIARVTEKGRTRPLDVLRLEIDNESRFAHLHFPIFDEWQRNESGLVERERTH